MPTASSPATMEEAAALLAAADRSGLRIRIGEDLRTDRLASVLEHEAGDLTCTVEAGITLGALRDALGPHGQRLSLDPPGDPTVGACLAGNLSGPLRHRFGAPRDLVLGVTLVLADGTVASAGGKVVKNVAGYDLGKLVCGSRGGLALIARVSLRLHPLPTAQRTLVVETGDPAGTVVALSRSQLQPSALDVLHPGRVAALFEGGEASTAEQLRRARSLVGGDEGDTAIWHESRARQGAACGRVRFEPGRLGEILTGLDEAVLRPSAGVGYVPFEVPTDLPEPARALNERIRAAFDPNSTLGGAAW
jgi:glycolate oxidase FAD binding subunit